MTNISLSKQYLGKQFQSQGSLFVFRIANNDARLILRKKLNGAMT